MEYTSGLIIDGVNYNIPMVSIKRTADFLEKYANRTEDGDIHIETIGVYKNYTVKIGLIDDPALYDKLFEHITDVDNRFHKVVLPDAKKSFTFTGYFSSIADEIEKIYDDHTQYKELTWKMTSKKPYKTP
jgi:hypothetical protein